MGRTRPGSRARGPVGAPWGEEAASAGSFCSWLAPNPVGALICFGDPPPLPSITSEAFIWLTGGIKMLLVFGRVLLVRF